MMDYPNDADGQALARIAEFGIDMSKPTPIEFAVASPDEDSAKEIFEIIVSKGYNSEIYYDEGERGFDDVDDDFDEFGPRWTVYVVVDIEPTYENVVRIQDELNKLVSQQDGKCDGWEVRLQ